MLRHIVMWKIKEDVQDKEAVKNDIKVHLEKLIELIPELVYIEVVGEPLGSSTHDIALISEFRDENDLKIYAEHPSHIEVAEKYIKPFAYERVCLDYIR